MDIQKEPKSNEIIDVNSAVNNLLDKIADAVINPGKTDEKTLIDIRDTISDLRGVDKSTKFNIFDDVKEKVEKASHLIYSDKMEDVTINPEVRTREDANSRKSFEEIDSNVDKTIKLLNDAISIIKGTSKLSEEIDIPKDVSKKVVTDIVITLLSKQLKSYYYFIFPDKSKKNNDEINITPLSQQKTKEIIPTSFIDKKNIVEVERPEVVTKKDEQNIDDYKLERNNKVNSDNISFPIATEKGPYKIGEFPRSILKADGKDLKDDIDLSNKSTIIKADLEVKTLDLALIDRKTLKNNELLDEDIEKSSKKLEKVRKAKDGPEKINRILDNADKIDTKYNESGAIESSGNSIVLAEDGESKIINNLDNITIGEEKILDILPIASGKEEKLKEEISEASDFIDKELNILAGVGANRKELLVTNIETETIAKATGSSSVRLFSNNVGELNNELAENVINITASPEEISEKNSNEFPASKNKIEKNVTNKITPSNAIGSAAQLTGQIAEFFGANRGTARAFKESVESVFDVPLVGVFLGFLSSGANSFNYIKAFATQYVAAQLQIGLSKSELYKRISGNNKDSLMGAAITSASEANNQLSGLIIRAEDKRSLRQSGENDFPADFGDSVISDSETDYRKSSFLEHKKGNADISEMLIKPNMEDPRNEKSVRDSYSAERSYNSVDKHPSNVGFLKIYTKRSMKFETSQSEIFYLPFQFEPKISGDSKSASYSSVSTLARSTPAQVYKNSGERKVSLELEYLITSPTEEISNELFPSESGGNSTTRGAGAGQGAGKASRGEKGNSISSIGMSGWNEEYIYEYIVRNFRNLTLPNMGNDKFKLGPPLVQVWYGGLGGTVGSSTGAQVQDPNNSLLNESHPTFRTNWYTLTNSAYNYYSMRSLWVCDNVGFDFKNGIINSNKRRFQNVVITVSLVEVGPSITDNEVLIWNK